MLLIFKVVVQLLFFCQLCHGVSPTISAKAIGQTANAISPESGVLRGTSSILAALSKVIEGREKEAVLFLNDVMATMTSSILNDRFIYIIDSDAIDNIGHSKEFTKTRLAFSNYNSVLLRQLFRTGQRINHKETLKEMKNALYFIKKEFSDELYTLPEHSRVMRSMKRINTWAKKEDLAEILSFAFDVISLRVNMQLLSKAIEDHQVERVAACCLGLCAGITGLKPFISAVASEIKISNGKGPIVGAFLNFAVTLIDIHDDKIRKKESKSQMNVQSTDELEDLSDHSKKQLRRLSRFLSDQKLGLTDIYVINQGVLPKWGILYNEDRGSLQFGAFGNNSVADFPVYRKEDSSDIFLVGGKPRRVMKAQQPTGDKEAEIIGFDFYGRFPKGYPYRGSTVFVVTDNLNKSDYRLNGIRINTCIRKPWYHPDDNLLFTDMMNLDQGEKVEAYTGKGDDVININGMFGQFQKASENVLKVDLGTGLNTLSFEGMNHDRVDIRGVYFDSRENTLSYFHGENISLHTVGIIEKVNVLIGSPFSDYIILFGNLNSDPNGEDFAVVQHYGKNFYEVNIDHVIDLNVKKTFRVIDNSKKTPIIVVRTSRNITRNQLIFAGNMFEVYGKTNRKTDVKVVISIRIVSKLVPTIKVVDSNDNSLMQDIASNHLGPEFVNGLSLITKGKSLLHGSEKDDICILECKSGFETDVKTTVTVDLGEGEDAIVLKDSTFFAPCQINDKDNLLTLEPAGRGGDVDEGKTKDADVDSRTNAWFITVAKKQNGKPKVIVRYLLKNVERVLNAFGSLIVNLANKKRDAVDLLADYITITSHEIGLSKR